MFFADTLETGGLGNRSHPAGGARAAVVVDPPRDIDRVIAAAAERRVRIVARRGGGRRAPGAVHALSPRLLAERPVSCADVTDGTRTWSAARLTGRGLAGTAPTARRLAGATLNARRLAGAAI